MDQRRFGPSLRAEILLIHQANKGDWGTDMASENPAFEKLPLKWIEAKDIEGWKFDSATWIPLLASVYDLDHGEHGKAGFRHSYRSIDTLIVPLELEKEFENVDWQSVVRRGEDAAWADADGFYPPGCYNQNPRILHPVITEWFDTDEESCWELLQELEVGLSLRRIDDNWLRPNENNITVAKLERDAKGRPSVLLFRTEHLRDYLNAKKAALLLTGFVSRQAVEEDFPDVKWQRQERQFEQGSWEATVAAIHEGGMPYGIETTVLHVWRESVDPSADNPQMPKPSEEPSPRSETFVSRSQGKKLQSLLSRTWVKHWIRPAERSPRIRREVAESRVHFHVDNQEQKTFAGNDLGKYRGWLWFKPSVLRRLLQSRNGVIEWYSEKTGNVGPSKREMLHFGINDSGFINVLGYKMAELEEWAQKMWAPDSIPPEGGLSEELHMAQNLAQPARTIAPELTLYRSLVALQTPVANRYGGPLLSHLASDHEFLRSIHRFYGESFETVCQLCKELHRVTCEPINIGLLNAKIDPVNAEESNEKKLRQIKRLALCLDTFGVDGRSATAALAGVADLRQGDAHAAGSELSQSLQLFGLDPNEEDFQLVCFTIIVRVADVFKAVREALLK